jgi:tetratricopeptide (TPR) repeat protein
MPRPLLFLLLLCLAGCASAKKSFSKAQEAESAGRWEEATDLYIDALRRDPEYPGAREGVRVAGGHAIEDTWKLAQQLESSGRIEDAAREYFRADALVARAAAVRVALELPPGYPSRRAQLFERVVEERLAAAEALAAQGRHEDAAAAYRRVEDRLGPKPEQVTRARSGLYAALMAAANQAFDAERFDSASTFADQAEAVYGPDSTQGRAAGELLVRIRRARYGALLTAAGQRMVEDRFQDAYAIVGEALAIYGPDAAESEEARALRDRVVAEGTQDVALVPVGRLDRVTDVPAGLLDDINDALEDSWAEPPLFVAAVDSRVVRGELRRLGFDRLVLADRQAQAIGQMVGAEFAVVSNLRACRFDAGEKPQVQAVKTQAGTTAEVLVYQRRSLVITCAFRIVRISDGSVVTEGTVTADAERRTRHAVYEGDMRALLLTQEQHRWFDARRLTEVDREIEREAAAGLAEGLAGAVFEQVLQRLP